MLLRSSLNIVATSRNPEATRKAILDGVNGLDSERLTVLPMDIMEENTIEKAAKEVKDKFGKGSLRLLINVSGVVSNPSELWSFYYLLFFEIDWIDDLKLFPIFLFSYISINL